MLLVAAVGLSLLTVITDNPTELFYCGTILVDDMKYVFNLEMNYRAYVLVLRANVIAFYSWPLCSLIWLNAS